MVMHPIMGIIVMGMYIPMNGLMTTPQWLANTTEAHGCAQALCRRVSSTLLGSTGKKAQSHLGMENYHLWEVKHRNKSINGPCSIVSTYFEFFPAGSCGMPHESCPQLAQVRKRCSATQKPSCKQSTVVAKPGFTAEIEPGAVANVVSWKSRKEGKDQ